MTQPAPFILTRLSVLFFLQFFTWGAWYLTGFRYMIAHEMSYNAFWLYTASPLGAILAPFFLGLCVDRFFNAEKVLAVCFLLGGAIMWSLPWIGDMAGTPVMQATARWVRQEVLWYTLTLAGITLPKSSWFNLGIFAHMLCFMPTLALTAALAFRHLPRGNEQFPLVRLWEHLRLDRRRALVLGFGFYLGGRRQDHRGRRGRHPVPPRRRRRDRRRTVLPEACRRRRRRAKASPSPGASCSSSTLGRSGAIPPSPST